LSQFRRKLAEELVQTHSPEVQQQCERYIGAVRNMSLSRVNYEIETLQQANSWMYDAADVLPLIALQLDSQDDLLVHFEQELPDGHDQREHSKHKTRLKHYLKHFHCNSFAVNRYCYSWMGSATHYDKISRADVTQYPGLIGNDGIEFNPFTWLEGSNFSKVLVEAPCNLDRISMNNPDSRSNIYQYGCKPYRMALPKLLEKMLVAAVLNATPYNGEIVYTTRTLNPLHNEFMVQFAIETLRENHGITVVPEPLDLLESCLSEAFEFESSLTLGSLVVPTLFKNSGPRYIVKLRRVVETDDETH